jgi:hypothetical protein
MYPAELSDVGQEISCFALGLLWSDCSLDRIGPDHLGQYLPM